MNDKPDNWKGQPPPAKHTCSVCQKVDVWGPTWGWYGSIKELESGNGVIKACSDGCFKEAKAMKLIPMNTELLDER